MTAPARAVNGLTLRSAEESTDPMSVYRPREKTTEKVQAYITPTLKDRLGKLGQFWTALDRAQQSDADEWKESEVIRRLLEAGVDAAWAEVEGGEPQTDDDLKRVLAAAKRALVDIKKR